jgi:hypothetical protein
VSHSLGVLTKPGEVHRCIARAYAFGQANRCRIACKSPVDSVGRPRRRGRRWVARVRRTTHQPFLEFGDHPDGAETVGTDPTKFVIMWERKSARVSQVLENSVSANAVIQYGACFGDLLSGSLRPNCGHSEPRSKAAIAWQQPARRRQRRGCVRGRCLMVDVVQPVAVTRSAGRRAATATAGSLGRAPWRS